MGIVLSPVLANVYLHELDTFVEDELIPQYTSGKQRTPNAAYTQLSNRIHYARRKGETSLVNTLTQQRRHLPSKDTHDPTYRRLRYVRYADDFILGFIGPKAEATIIKERLGQFLQEKPHLELSDAKTLITHARTEQARFLGYAISVYQADDKLPLRSDTRTKVRSVNGGIRLGIPYGRVDEIAKRYQRNSKPVHEAGLLAFSEAQIIEVYQQRFRGLAEYYKYAADRRRLAKLKHIMEVALVKTLANKYKTSVAQIYQRYKGKQLVEGRLYATLQVEIPTKKGTHCIYWGAVPLPVVNPGLEPLDDNYGQRNVVLSSRTDLIQRLQANQCEVCDSQETCEVHHVRKLANLKYRWRGRKEKPTWVVRMIALNRKTLVVCKKCHTDIHAGRPTPKQRTSVLGSGVP